MKNIISLTFVLAVGILSVMGCSQSGVVQLQDIPAPQSTPIVFGENIAAWGTASASVIGHSANEAIDGNPSTMWNSQHFAPHWFSVSFARFYSVNVTTQPRLGSWLKRNGHRLKRPKMTAGKRESSIYTP